jgi:pyridinium-3,5-bisthiocarboxylic acid mononucleotide nickel chelatase
MGKVAYVDMIGGAAGDMLMAAWVDAGVAVDELERALRSVVADGWELVVERVERGGISALHLDLVIPGEDDHAHAPDGTHHHHHHAHHGHRLRDILAIVERSGLTRVQIERASAIYRRIAVDEARENGEDPEEMVFHSVGQIDAILDVAGTCVALDLLGIEELRCSQFPTGDGLVTLTGAAILSTLSTPGPAIDMTLERVGYGAGRREFAIPNVVRVTIGERAVT